MYGRIPKDSRLHRAIETATLNAVTDALERFDGNRTAAAAHLSVSTRYLFQFLANHPEITTRFPGTPGRPRA